MGWPPSRQPARQAGWDMGARCNVLDKGTCCGSLKVDEALGTPPRTISAMGSSARRATPKQASGGELKPSPRPFEAKPVADVVKDSVLHSPHEEAPPKKSAVLKSAIAKVRSTVNISLEEQREFRRFLKPHFRTPAEAFDAFADGRPFIDHDHFIRKAEELTYSGNPEKVFHSLCDGQGRITRRAFQQSLKAAVQETKFSDVVMRAVEVQKATKKVFVVEPEPSERYRTRSHSPTPPSPEDSMNRLARRASR